MTLSGAVVGAFTSAAAASVLSLADSGAGGGGGSACASGLAAFTEESAVARFSRASSAAARLASRASEAVGSGCGGEGAGWDTLAGGERGTAADPAGWALAGELDA